MIQMMMAKTMSNGGFSENAAKLYKQHLRESIKVLSDICLDCPVCGTHELSALCVKFQDPNVNDEATSFFQVRR